MISIEIHIGKKKENKKSKEAGSLKRTFRGLPHSMLAVAVVTVGLTFGLASVGLATNGKALLAGGYNDETTPTVLQNHGTGPALDLRANSGPALAVNTSERVANLNADTVDGQHANAFLGATAKAADSDLLDGKDSTDFASAVHEHSGADITSGKVGAPFIDEAITRDTEVMPTVLANDGADSGLDADTVDDKNANDFTRVAQMVPSDPQYHPELSGEAQRYGQPLSVEAPAAGFVRLSGTVSASGPNGTIVFGYIRHIQTQDLSMPAASGIVATDGGSTWTYGNIALDAVFPVDQGTNTFELIVSGTPAEFWGVLRYPYVYYGQLTAEYTPYGPTGTDTLGTTANPQAISEQQLQEMIPK